MKKLILLGFILCFSFFMGCDNHSSNNPPIQYNDVVRFNIGNMPVQMTHGLPELGGIPFIVKDTNSNQYIIVAADREFEYSGGTRSYYTDEYIIIIFSSLNGLVGDHMAAFSHYEMSTWQYYTGSVEFEVETDEGVYGYCSGNFGGEIPNPPGESLNIGDGYFNVKQVSINDIPTGFLEAIKGSTSGRYNTGLDTGTSR